MIGACGGLKKTDCSHFNDKFRFFFTNSLHILCGIKKNTSKSITLNISHELPFLHTAVVCLTKMHFVNVTNGTNMQLIKK